MGSALRLSGSTVLARKFSSPSVTEVTKVSSESTLSAQLVCPASAPSNSMATVRSSHHWEIFTPTVISTLVQSSGNWK